MDKKMNKSYSVSHKHTKTKLPLFTWNSEWIWKYESPWGVFEKFKLANEIKDTDIFNIFGTEQIKSKTKAFYSYEERDLNLLKSFDDNSLFKVLGVKLKEITLVNINGLIGAFSNSNKLSFYIEKNLHFCPECIKLGYHSIFHQFKLLSKCPFHSNTTIQNRCPKCQNTIPYLLTDKWSRRPFTCKCGHHFYQSKDNNFIKEWSSNIRLVINSPDLVKWRSIDNSVKLILKEFVINEKVAKYYKNDLIAFYLSIIDNSSKSNNSYIHHKINNHKNTQLITTRKYYPFKVQMQQIVNKFNVEIFELNWMTFRGVEELILKYININYKKYIDDNELNPINLALKMWQKCVLGFEYYLDNRNSLNSKAWYNNSFFESIDEVQVIDDFYFELKNIFTRIDEHNITNFKWIFNRVISIILVNHFFNLVEHCETHINRGLEIPYLGIKYENIPFYLIKYNCDLVELQWWNKNNSL